MSDSQSLIIKGHVDFKLYNQYGELIDERAASNAITKYGRTILIQKAAGLMTATSNSADTIGIGTGTPSATWLGNYIAWRTASTTIQSTTAPYYATLSGTFPAGTGTGAITEAALFSGIVSIGYNVVSFGAINKGATDTLTISWQFSLTAT